MNFVSPNTVKYAILLYRKRETLKFDFKRNKYSTCTTEFFISNNFQALSDIEIAIKVLKKGDMSENPIDRHYHALNCDLEPVDKSTSEFKVRFS